jgi:hypothetical protein
MQAKEQEAKPEQQVRQECGEGFEVQLTSESSSASFDPLMEIPEDFYYSTPAFVPYHHHVGDDHGIVEMPTTLLSETPTLVYDNDKEQEQEEPIYRRANVEGLIVSNASIPFDMVS